MKSVSCPTCKQTSGLPNDNPSFPFCTSRCKLVDLGHWIDGEYAIDPATGKLEVIDPDDAELAGLEH